jgi:hypothetical protein
LTQPNKHLAIRDVVNSLGLDGEVYMRLYGLYWRGPTGTPEPEFGYADYSATENYPLIQRLGAELIEALAMHIVRQEVAFRQQAVNCARISPQDIAEGDWGAEGRAMAAMIEARLRRLAPTPE